MKYELLFLLIAIFWSYVTTMPSIYKEIFSTVKNLITFVIGIGLLIMILWVIFSGLMLQGGFTYAYY